MDVRPIYEAYVERMKALQLPATSIETYVKVTGYIHGSYTDIENPRQHRRTGRDEPSALRDGTLG